MAVVRNVTTAIKERVENLEIPQIPWPLVHPLPSRDPKPTSRPAMISNQGEALMIKGMEIARNEYVD